MAIEVSRGQSDETLDQVIKVLGQYEAAHPCAKIDIYRQNPVSVRIRIIDPDFSRLEKSERHDLVWKNLEHLDEDTQGDISMLVLLAPSELEKSFANLEFEDPVPSIL